METCIMCFEKLKYNGLYQILIKPCICHNCFIKLNRKPIIKTIDKIKVYALYPYENEIKNAIYQLKGCYDILLSKAFLSYDAKLFHYLFYNYVIIPVPSSKESDGLRGYNHVEEIFKSLNLKMVKALYKAKDFKQANLNKVNREKAVENIKLINNVNLQNKRLLLVDDIVTSGNTLKRCVSLLKTLSPKKLKIIVIAYSLSKKEVI